MDIGREWDEEKRTVFFSLLPLPLIFSVSGPPIQGQFTPLLNLPLLQTSKMAVKHSAKGILSVWLIKYACTAGYLLRVVIWSSSTRLIPNFHECYLVNSGNKSWIFLSQLEHQRAESIHRRVTELKTRVECSDDWMNDARCKVCKIQWLAQTIQSFQSAPEGYEQDRLILITWSKNVRWSGSWEIVNKNLMHYN